jgi:Ca2+-binding RTX toxin-like protein
MFGEEGNDELFGNEGIDAIWGGDGDDVLDGGIDGLADYLNGGKGKDKFRREWAYAADLKKVNRDAPSDLNAAEGDVLFGL